MAHILGLVWLCATVALASEWPSWSGPEPEGSPGLSNWRFARDETAISPANVGRLAVKWSRALDLYASTTPTLSDGLLFVTDYGGGVWGLDAATGETVWKRDMRELTGGSRFDCSRSAPLIVEDLVIIAKYGLSAGIPIAQGHGLYALNKTTGDLVWETILDETGVVTFTSSPVRYGDLVFLGLSCGPESTLNVTDGFNCRGRVYALQWQTGELVWVTYFIPEGYGGASVWGSGFSVDAERGHLYVPTGNIYSTPPEIRECEKTRPVEAPSCIPADVYYDSIVALDISTGAIVWGFRSIPYESWNDGQCQPPFTTCPFPTGPDFDFGSSPILFTVTRSGETIDALGAGSKSGLFFCVRRDTGELLWKTRVDPGGPLAGVAFGSAFDGQRLYVPGANSLVQPQRMYNSTVPIWTRGGAVSALDPDTGTILWQTPEPYNTAGEVNERLINVARVAGPATVANGVVFVSTMHPTMPNFFALDAATGTGLWEFFCGGSANSGPAVVDGVVYWTCGYQNYGGVTSPINLYAFHVPESNNSGDSLAEN